MDTAKPKFIPRSQATRQVIIEKTATIFNKKGYVGTSLSDLTAATQLTKGSIYGNFENKEDVALEAFRFNFQELGKRITAYVSREKSTIEQLFAFTRFYREDFAIMKYVGGCPLLNAGTDADDTNENLRREVVNAFEITLGIIEGIIEAGKASSEIRSDISGVKYSMLFFSLIEGSILLSKTTNKKSYLFEACDRIDKITREELIS